MMTLKKILIPLPGGKEYIGYITDRTGFDVFNRWALWDVTLPEIPEVTTPMN